jgi:hypothetical protein
MTESDQEMIRVAGRFLWFWFMCILSGGGLIVLLAAIGKSFLPKRAWRKVRRRVSGWF